MLKKRKSDENLISFLIKRASEKRLVGIKNSWKYEKDF